MMYEICDELDVPYEKSGTDSFRHRRKRHEGASASWKALHRENHVEARIVEPPELYELQPDIGEDVKAVLWVPGRRHHDAVLCDLRTGGKRTPQRRGV